jgi:hypothetical protein
MGEASGRIQDRGPAPERASPPGRSGKGLAPCLSELGRVVKPRRWRGVDVFDQTDWFDFPRLTRARLGIWENVSTSRMRHANPPPAPIDRQEGQTLSFLPTIPKAPARTTENPSGNPRGKGTIEEGASDDTEIVEIYHYLKYINVHYRLFNSMAAGRWASGSGGHHDSCSLSPSSALCSNLSLSGVCDSSLSSLRPPSSRPKR